MAPQCLELEITEGAAARDEPRRARRLIEPLHEMGVSFALDDFGTGYSSLASIKRFPLATVKIDRTFVADLGADDESGSVAAAIIATAHALRKRVVAEGVETERQAAILARLGCDHLQGHFCSPAAASAGLCVVPCNVERQRGEESCRAKDRRESLARLRSLRLQSPLPYWVTGTSENGSRRFST